jgi:hypothetical protein
MDDQLPAIRRFIRHIILSQPHETTPNRRAKSINAGRGQQIVDEFDTVFDQRT